MIALVIRWLVVTAVLFVMQPLAAGVFAVQMSDLGSNPQAGSPAQMLAWTLLSNGIIAAVLVGLSMRLRRRGAALAVGLFAVAFGMGHLLNLVEGYVFHVIAGPLTLRLLAMAATQLAAACALVAWLARRDEPGDASSAPQTAWWPSPLRLAIVAALYLVTYFTAGTLVFPFIASFYTPRGLPPVALVAGLQLFVRGPLFGVIIAWIVAATRGGRAVRAVWAGAALSLLGGVAPLLIPTPAFPDHVRWAHFIEVSTSNFIFGVLAGWLLAQPALAILIGARAAGDPLPHP